MFGKKLGTVSAKGYDSTIESKVNIDGNIYTESSLYIAAKLNGEIRSDSDVYIGADGIINGNIFARNISIAGIVEGTIEASGALRILSTGKLYGDISVFRFILSEGAVFEGKCTMSDLTTHRTNQNETRLLKSESSMFRKKDYIEDKVKLQIGETSADKG
ncbi:MAG: polymer-forming cytoskeletal protein [Oscillospiraceae bacterium]|nr:polymer-forming cytoskeletal protein [Oscillospiraceae bacterium]